jgi:hypothetical protein
MLACQGLLAVVLGLLAQHQRGEPPASERGSTESEAQLPPLLPHPLQTATPAIELLEEDALEEDEY